MSAVKYEVLISLQLMPWTMGNGHPPNITQMREHAQQTPPFSFRKVEIGNPPNSNVSGSLATLS